MVLHDLCGDSELDKDESSLCKKLTNDDHGPIKEKNVTWTDATLAEAVKRERTISPLRVPAVGNINVTSGSKGKPNFQCFL